MNIKDNSIGTVKNYLFVSLSDCNKEVCCHSFPLPFSLFFSSIIVNFSIGIMLSE